MEKDMLARKIKELRNRKGYSQEYLSEVAKLSLRTIQRIENGETIPRGDTLNRLAKALEIDIDELTEMPHTADHHGYLVLMNLSALLFLIIIRFAALSFAVPLFLWLYKKNEFTDVYERGKQILNFQITYSLISALGFVLAWVWSTFPAISRMMPYLRGVGMGLGLSEVMLIGVFFFVTGFNVVMIIVNTVLLLTGKEMKYWPVYRFLK